MTERYSFAVERHLVDGSVVWNQDNMENSALSDTMNEGYVTAEEDSPTRYLSVLDTTSDISLENLNITLSNPKLEVEDVVENYTTEEVLEQPEDNNEVVVFSVEGSEELYGVQVVQDEEGNLQKYQFQFRKNEEGHLEAIPETITLLPMEEDTPEAVPLQEPTEYNHPMSQDNAMHIYVEEDNSGEHILPDNHGEEQPQEEELDESTIMFQNEEEEEEEVHEETLDIKPGVLQLQNVKQEMQEPQVEYDTPDLIEPQSFNDNIENQPMTEFKVLPDAIQQQSEENFQYTTNIDQEPTHSEENSMESQMTPIEYQETEPEPIPEPDDHEEFEHPTEDQEFEHVEVNPDMTAIETVSNPEENEETEDFNNDTVMNDSDENDYHIVEGLHITGDVDSGEVSEDQIEKPPTNILKHALKNNKDSPKIVKKDNKLYLYVVHPEKENVDSLSMEMSNLCKTKVNPRSILKSSHAMFQAKNENETNASDERMNKRFARCKEAMQAMLFHNFINKTTIPQAPVRKNRLPRKQKIKPVERMDEEIVVQEMMVSSNGFVEAVSGGVNKENLAVTEYVELTDSDDDYDPKKVNRKKKKHRRRRIEITISDESDASHDSVIELDESDDETNKDGPRNTNNNNTTPPKRRRGRPPKNKTGDSSVSSIESSAAKKSKFEQIDAPAKPEIPCPKCDKTFPSQNSLKTHLQHHNLQSSIKRALPEYKYKCETCASTFINNILLRKHMCSKLFNCTVCKKKFPDLSSLNGHKRTHAKEQMLKSTTVAQVSPKKIIKPTLPSTFKVPKMNKCKVCGKLCSSLQNLNAHMKTHKEFGCGSCGKTFLSQLMLEKHVRENCVKSPQLNRRSLRSHSLNRKGPSSPLQKKSLSEKRSAQNSRLSTIKVKCEHCGVTFFSYQALFQHKVLKHGLDTPDKSVVEKKVIKNQRGEGVPAAKRLQDVYSNLSCQLDFNE